MDILPNVHVSLGVGWNGWDEMIYSSRHGFLLVEVPYTGSAVVKMRCGVVTILSPKEVNLDE